MLPFKLSHTWLSFFMQFYMGNVVNYLSTHLAPDNPHQKKYLRNRSVAHIFATERLLKWPFISMRRDVFQAIADPTRRAILSLLALQAMTPNALADHFDSSRQAISKHIRILTECQLITQQQTGREIYYYFNSKKLKEVDKWLEQFRAMWDTRFTQLDTLLKTIKNKKS